MFCFQILLSHHNNHSTALYGLAAASDVYGEKGGEAHAAGRWPIPYSTTQHIGESPTSPPRFALSVRYKIARTVSDLPQS